MATINLGSIKFNWQGTYAGGTAYSVDDVVSYNGTSYVCILASTGNLPTNATYWNVMAQGGTDLTTTLTTQGDILYRDGSGLQRLGAGTSGQALLMNSGATAPEWGTASSGKIIGVHYANFTGVTTNGASSYSWQDVTNLTKTITPASSSSKFWIYYRLSVGSLGNHVYSRINVDGTAPFISDAYSSSFRATNTVAPKVDWDLDTHSASYLWSPATASAVTIKIQWCGENSNDAQYINRSSRDNGTISDGRATSDMTIFEIDS
jgi:hypothetical protein